MRVPTRLVDAFGKPFEDLVSRFAVDEKLLPQAEDLRSSRFLSRSVVPHVRKLSSLFNRMDAEQKSGLDPYWKESSNPAHLRLAYFLYFMPPNVFRTASIWAELASLGYRWPENRPLKGIDLGAGPASGACGIAAGERHSPTPAGLPSDGNWALIEQDKATLELGARWAETYFAHEGFPDWGLRKFHRKLDFAKPLLPPAAPRFNLWLMSFFLNESTLSSEDLAESLNETWRKHLEDEALVILVEPALKQQSRRLLELRKALIDDTPGGGRKKPQVKVLLPCLGHQACGALAAEEDWCHEEVSWWRPSYFRQIDQMAELDRKTLPFSYLVLTKSNRPVEEILPALKGSAEKRYRLVSPSHYEGKEQEFFVCGQDGKRRARYRSQEGEELGRGDILEDADIRGDRQASRVERMKRVNAEAADTDELKRS